MIYYFIVPTLNRADVLPWSIQSILDQHGNHDFCIIVSNNKSTDDTKDVVARFRDERVLYREPLTRLSMSTHWEFACSFVKHDDAVVCFIGDDDLVGPDALDIVDLLLADRKVDSVTRLTGYYHTRDCDSPYAGWLMLPVLDGGVSIQNSQVALTEIASGTRHYANGPNLYHGFVRNKVLLQIKRSGPLFNKAAPDIYSDIALAAMNINYACVRYPLTLGVASPKSNGLNAAKRNAISEEYFQSSINELKHSYPLTSTGFHVLDCLEDVITHHCLGVPMDYRYFYKIIMREAAARPLPVEWIAYLLALGKTSPFGIKRDHFMASIKAWLQTGLANGTNALRRYGGFRASGDTKGAFGYHGDIYKSHGVTSPQECLRFIRDRVAFKGL